MPEIDPEFQVVTTSRAFEAVVNQIKEGILNGTLHPGQFLPAERKLMQAFGVSRTTLREAVRTLEQMGLCVVSRGPRGGVQIKAPSTEAIADALGSLIKYRAERLPEIVEARMIIESQIAQLAVERATTEELDRLETFIRDMERYTDACALTAYVEADWGFHLATAEACHNFLLESIITSMGQTFKDIISGLAEYDTFRKQGVIEHRLFLNRLKARDNQGAVEALVSMLSVPSLKRPD